jgi:hypothetical protein
LLHNWDYRSKIAGGADLSHRTRLRMHLKMSEALRMVHKSGMGLLREWWWLVSPKLVFENTAEPVPESMDGSLYIPQTAEPTYRRLILVHIKL